MRPKFSARESESYAHPRDRLGRLAYRFDPSACHPPDPGGGLLAAPGSGGALPPQAAHPGSQSAFTGEFCSDRRGYGHRPLGGSHLSPGRVYLGGGPKLRAPALGQNPPPGCNLAGACPLDFTFYWWHRANHRSFLLWRFHGVHHLDPDLDVATATRFHFGEVLYSTGLRFLQVGLLGVDGFTFLLYEVAYQAVNMFQHANLRLPMGLERVLNKITVTPRMHGIHHSVVSDEVGSNFSVVFRWWDALHRTLRLNIPQQDIIIGVAGYLSPEHNRFWRLVVLPLSFSKNYWLWPDGSEPKRHPSATPRSPGIIVE